jgi:hypothetical protein
VTKTLADLAFLFLIAVLVVIPLLSYLKDGIEWLLRRTREQ